VSDTEKHPTGDWIKNFVKRGTPEFNSGFPFFILKPGMDEITFNAIKIIPLILNPDCFQLPSNF